MKQSYPKPPTAPAANRRAVIRPEPAETLYGATGRPYAGVMASRAEEQRVLFHEYLRGTDDVPLDQIAALQPSSLTELAVDTYQIFEKAIAPGKHHDAIAHAALAGSSDVVALLDMASRLAAQSDIHTIDTVYPIAHKSAATLLELAAHSEAMDSDLTIGLGQYSQQQINTLDRIGRFSAYRFDPKFFTLDNSQVVIDYSKRREMRIGGTRKIDFTPNHREIVLGCPYTSRIGKLYRAMTDAAQTSQLLEEIYEKERANNPTSDPEQ